MKNRDDESDPFILEGGEKANDSEYVSKLNESDSSSIDKEILEDNHQILETEKLQKNEEEIISNYRNEQNEHVNEDISNHDTDHDRSEVEKSQTTVKRLSLFDTVEQDVKNLSNQEEERSEPVISENDKEIHNHEANDSDKDPETEFNSEESDSDEEFNQETEDELLDIPTFLRRQAN